MNYKSSGARQYNDSRNLSASAQLQAVAAAIAGFTS
jgi:hypothetical protein